MESTEQLAERLSREVSEERDHQRWLRGHLRRAIAGAEQTSRGDRWPYVFGYLMGIARFEHGEEEPELLHWGARRSFWGGSATRLASYVRSRLLEDECRECRTAGITDSVRRKVLDILSQEDTGDVPTAEVIRELEVILSRGI